jgi:hypothetical protein
LYVVSDEHIRERIGRMMSRKASDTEIAITPPKDGMGFPLETMAGEVDETEGNES